MGKFFARLLAVLGVLWPAVTTPGLAFAAGNGLFDGNGGYGSGWVQMLRGNGTAPMADQANSAHFAAALRTALGLYSNALLIVASLMLLYYLIVMTAETAHEGVPGGKRTNQVWAPLRLVIAIGLLVPLSSGLNSAQYAALQVVEWGSNLATQVWVAFVNNSGTGAGTGPSLYIPDTTGLVREVAKIQACKVLLNHQIDENLNQNTTDALNTTLGVSQQYAVQLPIDLVITETQPNPFVTNIGNAAHESLCGSIIYFGFGLSTLVFNSMYTQVGAIMEKNYSFFLRGNANNFAAWPPNTLPFDWGNVTLAAAGLGDELLTGTLAKLLQNGWGNGASAAADSGGWVTAGSYFLQLAGASSSFAAGIDTLPIVMGPKTSLIHSGGDEFDVQNGDPADRLKNDDVYIAYTKMVQWITGKYKGGVVATDPTTGQPVFQSGGPIDMDQMGDSFAGRKFIDLILLYLDQMGVTDGLWNAGSGAFTINLNNNPLLELIALGHRMIRSSLDFSGMAVEMKMNGSQNFSFGTHASEGFADIALPTIHSISGSLMALGLLLGIFVPMMPFFKFVLSVMTWVISLLEVLICVPLMALAWLNPYGDGLAGQKVEAGYHLILHTFLRPVLTIFGLVGAMLCFNIGAYLITNSYYAVTGQTGTFLGGMYVIAKIGFGVVYVSLIYAVMNVALKVMDVFGRNAITWMGGQSHEETNQDIETTRYLAEGSMQGMQLGGVAQNIQQHFAGNADALNKSAAGGISDAEKQRLRQQNR